MEGYYYNYIFELNKTDYFEGSLEISNRPKTAKPVTVRANFSDLPENDLRSSVLWWVNGSDSHFDGTMIVVEEDMFSEIYLDFTDDEVVEYIFPATNKDEALAVKTRLSVE